jgi:hypothetical protein
MRKRTGKGIIAIESWEGDVTTEPRVGMRSLLGFSSDFYGTKLSYSFVYTPSELTYILENISLRDHSLLYLSLHGRPDHIKTGMYSEFQITLDTLSDAMGKRFSGFGVHFASCSVLSAGQDLIREFIEKTGVSFVSGYTKDVDFMSSSLADLSFISTWMFFKSFKRMFKSLTKSSYKQLLLENGFKYYL